MKKYILIILCMLIGVCLTGCVQKKEQEKDLYTIIKQRGKLIAGVKFDSRPFGFIDQDEQLKGFDVDLCKEIARRLLGSENAIEFKQVTSSNRIMAISSGTVDLAAATMTITDKRREIIDFSNPYYIAGQAIMISKNSPIKNISELENKKIIVTLGSTSEANIKHMFPTAEILGFRTYTDAFSALKNNRGDAMTTDDTIIYGFMSETPGFAMLDERLTKEPYGIGFKKGRESAALREVVNQILEELAKDGTLNRLKQKWIHNNV